MGETNTSRRWESKYADKRHLRDLQSLDKKYPQTIVVYLSFDISKIQNKHLLQAMHNEINSLIILSLLYYIEYFVKNK